MKKYNSIEEMRVDWTPKKQQLYDETFERNWGHLPKDELHMYLINDRELDKITGCVVFKIPVG